MLLEQSISKCISIALAKALLLMRIANVGARALSRLYSIAPALCYSTCQGKRPSLAWQGSGAKAEATAEALA